MGDRCYMSVTCRKADVPLFTGDGDLGFSVDTEDDQDGVVVTDDERYPDIDDLPKDIPFYGYHEAGCSYGPGCFACDGTDCIELEAAGGMPVTEIYRNGEVSEYAMRQARIYYRILANAERLMQAAFLIEAQREALEAEARVAMGLPAQMPEYEGTEMYSDGGGD